MTPPVAVIVLNWNGWRDTVECADSLLAMNYPRLRLIIVDNGSTDDSVGRLRDWANGPAAVSLVEYDAAQAEQGGVKEREASGTSKAVILIRAGENLGFAKGNNLGARYALAHGPEFIWLLNNDTIVQPDTLEKLSDFLVDQPEYAAVTGQTRYYGDRERIWNCGGQLTWYGTRRYEFRHAPAGSAPKTGARRITFMTGCAPLFRASVLSELGLLPTRFFFGEEDFELSHAMLAKGRPMACLYDALIYHKVSSSANLASKDNALGMVYVHYLCRLINLRGHWPAPVWHLWRLAYLPYILFLSWRACKPTLGELLGFAASLLRESSQRAGVDRDAFQEALKHGMIPRRSYGAKTRFRSSGDG